MNTKKLIWLTVLLLLLAAGCESVDVSKDSSGLIAEEVAEAELSRQLKINRDALLKGSSERIRVDSATVMLFNEDPMARKVLLEALRQTEVVTARIAICKSLIQARTEQKQIHNKEDFIEPLFEILNTETDDSAKLAAEAILIFEYEQISRPLENMVTDSTLLTEARLNAIYALRLQPDMRAIFKLIELLDETDTVVASEAEKALRFLGTPIGKDAETREQIRSELKRKSRDEFFRDLLIRQEAQMRKLESERNFWQNQYLKALGRIYEDIETDVSKGQFLAEYLGGSKVEKLWVIEKVSQWRVGTKSKLPSELGPILIGLVSSPDRDVRLKTAKVLSLMSELNSAEKLVEQLNVEQDEEVRVELFVALGGACYYAFLPNSGIKIAPEVRKQTLEMAAEYLSGQDPMRAQRGAEVIKKLLEQDGLTSGEVDKYLGLLAQKYEEQKDNANGTLRGELLRAMAGLCAQSVYKVESARLFRPFFEDSVSEESDLVREAAVEGLIYVDKSRALKILRRMLVNDSSIKIRRRLINLAGEVGGEEDLIWLGEKIGATAESELAWQVMLKIFKRSGADILGQWVFSFESQSGSRLSDEQWIAFLEIAERKALGEDKIEMLRDVRGKLARLYIKGGNFEQSAKYLGMIYEDAPAGEAKERVLGELLGVYLSWPNLERAEQLVANCLLEKDLGADDIVVRSIESYFEDSADGVERVAVLRVLSRIEVAEQGREMWVKQLELWSEKFGVKED